MELESWLQRNWRPLLMVLMGVVVVNAYLIAPYMIALGVPLPAPGLPERLWDLITMVFGGYMTFRTAEKVVARLKP